MNFTSSHNFFEVPRDNSLAKFIVIKPDEQPRSPELFVSNNPGDGYDLTFESLAEFEAWRRQEEETYTIEFVRGDSHESRSNPPRFKEHVKLVCARHSRRGRKQYVKKFPERIRKMPSRKIHGTGCPASICYKTYVNTGVVRVMYHREHSHPTGPENLPFTKKGRRILASRNNSDQKSLVKLSPSTSNGEFSSPNVPQLTFPSPSWSPVSGAASSQKSACSTPSVNANQLENMSYDQVCNHLLVDQPFNPHLHSPREPYLSCNKQEVQDSLNLYDPVPAFDHLLDIPSAHTTYARWDRLATLFHSIHERALSFEYPQGTFDVLEDVLVKLCVGSDFMGEVLANNQGYLGFDVLEGTMKATRANYNDELVHPAPVRNMRLSTSGLFRPGGPPAHVAAPEPRLC